MYFEQIKKIISEQLSLSDTENKIFLETNLREDLNLDSFDAVQLVIKLEHFFDLKISDEIMMQFKTVQDIVNYIKNNKLSVNPN
ncbi:Acyl carrier protein [Candidatus Phytoplasma pini]|uniref:Acyl carrier protein n=2 Tax=Candidatus Phytoplasma pini TaxID=267362 RepID=A0A559KJQ2_9MOLU|nr:Acyl carrier protein [Candidatus Phytoplasma pini]